MLIHFLCSWLCFWTIKTVITYEEVPGLCLINLPLLIDITSDSDLVNDINMRRYELEHPDHV